MSLELIDKFDGFEIVRDKIAAILVAEVANQKTLAAAASEDPALWDLNVYIERSNPWEKWIDSDDTDDTPIVNVWYDSSTYPMNAGTTMERQKTEGVFNVDIYGFGAAKDEAAGGHTPGDLQAALNAQRAARLVRNILMAAENTYLGLRGTVGRRWIRGINQFQPQQDGRSVQQIVGIRIAMQVDFNEFSPQVLAEVLELLSVTVKRTEDGQVILLADYDYT